MDDVLSALTNLGYQRPAAEKAIEQAIAKDAALAGDFDGLFRGALKVRGFAVEVQLLATSFVGAGTLNLCVFSSNSA